MNPAAQGKGYPPTAFEVSAERVAAFAAVLGAPADSVPPTFLAAVEFTVFPEVIDDPALDLDFSRVVHGEQEYEWRRPLRIGETISARPTIASIKQRGGLGFVTIETLVHDVDGELVAVCRSTMIERSPR